jgi:hypothetical protein
VRLFLAVLAVLTLSSLAAPPSAVASTTTHGTVARAAASIDAGIGIRLVDIPANAQADPRAHSYIVDNLAPGTTIDRRVEVQNNSSTAQSVRIYAGAAHISSGSFVGDAAASTNELTQWTSVDQPTLELAPGARALVRVTIAIPSDAAPGEHYGALWAEIRSAPQQKTGIVSASRTGIRLYLSVGPGNGPASDFTVKALTASRAKSGEPRVIATVTNTGGRALDVSGELSLTGGPSGLSAGPFSTTTATTLAPGDTDTVAVALGPDLPSGPWNAYLTLRSGVIAHAVTARITFPKAGAAVAVAADRTEPPVALIGLAGAVIAVALVGLLVWRRKRRGRPARHTP